jgi:sulfur transfer protein SufE
MDPYAKLIKYGEKNGRPRKNKDNEESVNKLAGCDSSLRTV